jgi:hypothetical protein
LSSLLRVNRYRVNDALQEQEEEQEQKLEAEIEFNQSRSHSHSRDDSQDGQDKSNPSHIDPANHPAFGLPLKADGSLQLTSNPTLNSLMIESFRGLMRQYGMSEEVDDILDKTDSARALEEEDEREGKSPRAVGLLQETNELNNDDDDADDNDDDDDDDDDEDEGEVEFDDIGAIKEPSQYAIADDDVEDEEEEDEAYGVSEAKRVSSSNSSGGSGSGIGAPLKSSLSGSSGGKYPHTTKFRDSAFYKRPSSRSSSPSRSPNIQQPPTSLSPSLSSSNNQQQLHQQPQQQQQLSTASTASKIWDMARSRNGSIDVKDSQIIRTLLAANSNSNDSSADRCDHFLTMRHCLCLLHFST